MADDERGTEDLEERARAAGLPPLHGAPRPRAAAPPPAEAAPAGPRVARRIPWRGGRVAVAAAAVLATAGLAAGLWMSDAAEDGASEPARTPAQTPATGFDGTDGTDQGGFSPATPDSLDQDPGFAVPQAPEVGPGGGFPDGGSGAS